MAYKSRTWECPDCQGQFTTVMDDRDGPPQFCQLCGNSMGVGPEPILSFARVGKVQNQTLDKVYRGMEAASYARRAEAAEMMGVPEHELSGISMSNMKDRPKEGETSFIAPQNAPQPVSAPPPSNVMAMPGSVGLATAQQVKAQGGSIGNKVLDGFRKTHTQRAHQMQRAGQIDSYAGK